MSILFRPKDALLVNLEVGYTSHEEGSLLSQEGRELLIRRR